KIPMQNRGNGSGISCLSFNYNEIPIGLMTVRLQLKRRQPIFDEYSFFFLIMNIGKNRLFSTWHTNDISSRKAAKDILFSLVFQEPFYFFTSDQSFVCLSKKRASLYFINQFPQALFTSHFFV